MKKGKVFQEDFSELDPVILPNTYSSGRQQDLAHRNLLIFKYRATINVSIYFCQHAENLHHADTVK